MNSASLLGNITSSLDKDGVIRRSRISYNFNGNEYVTLGFAGEILESENISDSISEIKSKVPLLKDETVLLRYKDFSKYAGYRAWDILKSAENHKKGLPSDFVPSDFENCTVFFMFYAPGLYDICSTPMSKNYPGSGVHITLLDNYLTDDFVKKVPVAFDLIYSLIFAFLGGILVFLVENRTKHFKILYFVLIVVFGQFINLLITRSFFDSNYYINSILMCSKNTKDEAQKSGSSLYFRELARVKVVGKNNAITVFEPVVREEYEAQKEKYSTFEKALNCFYKADFDEAQKLFESIKKTDGVSEKYIQKCEEMKNLGEEELKNFNGVWVAKNK